MLTGVSLCAMHRRLLRFSVFKHLTPQLHVRIGKAN